MLVERPITGEGGMSFCDRGLILTSTVELRIEPIFIPASFPTAPPF